MPADIASVGGMLVAAAAVALAFTTLLGGAAIVHHNRTGPDLGSDVVRRYRAYTAYAFSRQVFWTFLLTFACTLPGVGLYSAVLAMADVANSPLLQIALSAASLLCIVIYQFFDRLMHMPSMIIASWAFDLKRLNRLWQVISPLKLFIAKSVGVALYGVAIVVGAAIAVYDGRILLSVFLLFAAIITAAPYVSLVPSRTRRNPSRPRAQPTGDRRPNILMIGADTLRVDKLGIVGYSRDTTPFLDALARQSWFFENCYVPLARTAPSLVTLFTGLWPFEHGVRDNFVPNLPGQMKFHALPHVLRSNGYRSLAISDWSGADLEKFPLGFDKTDVADDQWNLKYCLRQGQRHLRLFLSLFAVNKFGKTFLPEVFYQAGIPLTTHLTDQTKRALTDFSADSAPFLLNVFMGTTHVPFGCEYPYYLDYASSRYMGHSKFVMSTFRDPNEIVDKQTWHKDLFDVEQISKLYDSCIRRFDDAVREILSHLDELGLRDNTIVIVYSDHGLDFFENETWGQGNSVRGRDWGSRVPLIIQAPGCQPSRIRTNVSGIDVMPTVLELCGLDVPDGVSGRSLVAPARDEPDRERPIYLETGIWMANIRGMLKNHLRYPTIIDLLTVPDLHDGTLTIRGEYHDQIIRAKDRAIRLGKWKLEYFPTEAGPVYMLFDVDNDPDCTDCLASRHPEELEMMKAVLKSVLGTHASELIG